MAAISVKSIYWFSMLDHELLCPEQTICTYTEQEKAKGMGDAGQDLKYRSQASKVVGRGPRLEPRWLGSEVADMGAENLLWLAES